MDDLEELRKAAHRSPGDDGVPITGESEAVVDVEAASADVDFEHEQWGGGTLTLSPPAV